MNNRGQFSIIAALLMAIILAGTLIAVYTTVRYGSSQTQTPQTLTATDQTNAALLKALGFTVGYYGSILQVTGNQTYAYANATTYMNSALQYIASMNPSLGEAINMTHLSLSNNWFSNPSISTGKLSVVYDLAALGIYGINYTTSCSLGVQILNSPNANQVRLNVTQDLTDPLTSLGQQNFNFYFYNYSTANWQLINPGLAPTISTNGTYLINVPSGIDSSAYMVQVTDSRGIMVQASSYNSYNMNFTFSNQATPAPAIVELLQNGTMRWFGQSLLNTTFTRPIPPISISSLHLCQTGYTSDLPFQVEDWASQYQIPLSMSNNYTIFGNSQMVVFEVSPSMSQLTLWWNGSDAAIQPSAAYKDTYFTGDNPIAGTGTLSNGNVTLQFSYPGSSFQIKSTVGSVSSTANFMRIDGSASTYGSSSPNYVIHNGVVRDIVQEEAEWTNGPTNSPNVYSQIVFTLPANVTYYTYQLRLIYIDSNVARNINDINPIKLTTSVSPVQAMTENGTLNGIPNITNGTGTFTNSTGNAHHWSQLINNVTLQGTGIMFTDSDNQRLYAFDSMAGKFTGALYVSSSTPVIELDPVTSEGPVSFTSALDLTWSGAVDTFNGINPICANNGTSGLWPVVEQPPSITVSPQSSAATSITISPSIGLVGTSVTVSGGGFIPDSLITVMFNKNIVATTTATAYGAIPSGTAFTIPISVPGPYAITAIDTSSNSGSANFTLVPLVTISLQLNGVNSDVNASTILTIDSVPYTYLTLPSSFIWPAGSGHTITASTVAAGSGKQYAWVSWSDGGAQTHTYTVPTSNDTLTVNFGVQWQMTFNQSGLDGTTASGTVLTVNETNVPYSSLPYVVWVNSSDRLVYNYNATIASSTTGKQFILGIVSPVSPLVGISNAQTVTCSYNIQYQLTMATNFGSVSPVTGNWYNAGSSVTIYAVSPSVDAGEQSVWNGWTGSGSGSYTGSGNNSALVTMNGAITETASWTHQWYLTFQQNGLSIDASGTVLTLGASTYTYTQLPLTNIWVNDGTTYSFTGTISAGSGKQYLQTSVTGPTSPIHSSGTVVCNYNTQYQLTMVTNFGSVSPVTGNWYNAGSSVTIYAVSPSVGAGERYVWNGWTGSGSGSYTGSGNNSALVTMNGAITETASWTHQYQLTMVTNFGSVSPVTGNWYNAGSSVTIYAVSPSVGAGERYVWNGWTGSGSGSYTGSGNNSALVTMNGAITETASWTHQYQVTFVVNPSGSGSTNPSVGTSWQNAGTITITASKSGGYKFNFWSATGSITIANPTQGHGSNGSSTTATISGSGTITANFQ